ncbi:undecaprenyldiphospho-muramoylpentapeptide beta-N-acetylglucosaminyltransferase [Romboutsia lituseburensis]|nr:glycosyltransferase [Romboutsia lituseburensis]CEH33393.1 undecaprenyldiphospho-muramoylpentapeptide beta-N-acetylglucosaminyltransferase [Romboutsia lituseburensis]
MIFVTLGTFEMKFTRILNQLEKLDLKDKVIIQSGHTHFKSNKYQVINFMGKEEFRYYLEKADIVICHGGVGSILEAINFKKRVIAIPRLIKYNEHVDNHQVEIVKKFIKEGYIIGTINEKK